MTESVAMEEYDQMVAEGIMRQKTAEKEVNNNIRDNYMNRLGMRGTQTSDSANNRTSNYSA
jgi:hypothetical protein